MITAQQLEQAAELRRQGWSWELVGVKLGGISAYRLRAAMQPDFSHKRKLQSYQSRERRKLSGIKLPREKPQPKPESKFEQEYGPRVTPWLHESGPRPDVPPEVLAERDRRLALPRSVFGDPPAGYSALDKRRG